MSGSKWGGAYSAEAPSSASSAPSGLAGDYQIWPTLFSPQFMIDALGELIDRLARVSVVEGDDADRALGLAKSFRKAISDHPNHGRNWEKKYGAQLKALVLPLFKQWFPTIEKSVMRFDSDSSSEKFLEGMELEDLARRIFGGRFDHYRAEGVR